MKKRIFYVINLDKNRILILLLLFTGFLLIAFATGYRVANSVQDTGALTDARPMTLTPDGEEEPRSGDLFRKEEEKDTETEKRSEREHESGQLPERSPSHGQDDQDPGYSIYSLDQPVTNRSSELSSHLSNSRSSATEERAEKPQSERRKKGSQKESSSRKIKRTERSASAEKREKEEKKRSTSRKERDRNSKKKEETQRKQETKKESRKGAGKETRQENGTSKESDRKKRNQNPRAAVLDYSRSVSMANISENQNPDNAQNKGSKTTHTTELSSNPASSSRRSDHNDSSGGYTLQLGAFSSNDAALRMASTLKARGFQPRVVKQKKLYLVQVGNGKSRNDLKRLGESLKKEHYSFLVIKKR